MATSIRKKLYDAVDKQDVRAVRDLLKIATAEDVNWQRKVNFKRSIMGLL